MRERSFEDDTTTERLATNLFDLAYRQLWPTCRIHRFGQMHSNGTHKRLQHAGIDVVILFDDSDPYEALTRFVRGDRRACLTIDEKATNGGGLRPGLPIEVEHRWCDGTVRPGWVLDPQHISGFIAYGCLVKREVHIFSCDEVKLRWKECIDQSRWSTKHNVGLYGDTWTTQACYTKGYDCFAIHREIHV
jgi:hypothetical protein